jgi:hypothetical protein
MRSEWNIPRQSVAKSPSRLGVAAKQVLHMRHGRACPGHPRRWAANTSGDCHDLVKRHGKIVANLFHFLDWTTWMAGTSPAMTAVVDSII